MEVWIGTSGYSYPEWVGDFYPPGTAATRMFTHYVRHFPLVELNSTFYRPPTPKNLARLARQAPPGFQFVVKLHRAFSHDHDWTGAAPFRDAVEVLRRDGRLLGLLCQYPQRFHHDAAGLRQLEALAQHFDGYPLAVEFRHHSWHVPKVPAWLEAHGLHLVSVDVPAIPALFPSGLVQCSRLVYVRLHSHRAASWYGSGEDRYDYLYSDEEMTRWVEALAGREEVDRALVLFNNCRRGYAAQNALRMGELFARTGTALRLVPPFPPAPDEQGWLF